MQKRSKIKGREPNAFRSAPVCSSSIPLRVRAGAAAVEGVGFAADGLGAVGGHDTAAVEPVPFSAELQPPRLHDAGAVEVVPLAAQLLPAGESNSVGIVVIPLAVLLLPASQVCPLGIQRMAGGGRYRGGGVDARTATGGSKPTIK